MTETTPQWTTTFPSGWEKDINDPDVEVLLMQTLRHMGVADTSPQYTMRPSEETVPPVSYIPFNADDNVIQISFNGLTGHFIPSPDHNPAQIVRLDNHSMAQCSNAIHSSGMSYIPFDAKVNAIRFMRNGELIGYFIPPPISPLAVDPVSV